MWFVNQYTKTVCSSLYDKEKPGSEGVEKEKAKINFIIVSNVAKSMLG
jgi:hypothetical protein